MKFVDPHDHFSIEFYGEPQSKIENLPGLDQAMTSHFSRDFNTRTVWLIGYVKIEPGMIQHDRLKQLFDDSRRGMLEKVPPNLTPIVENERDVVYEKYPAREFTIRFARSGNLHVRLIVAENRFYIQSTETNRTRADQSVTRFMDSLRFFPHLPRDNK